MNKFIITEQERSRILVMHKKRTSNHYLMEQVSGDTLEGLTIQSLDIKKGSFGTSVTLSNGKTYTYTSEDVTTFPQMVYSGWCGSGKFTPDTMTEGCSATVTLGPNLRFECDKQGCKKVDDIE